MKISILTIGLTVLLFFSAFAQTSNNSTNAVSIEFKSMKMEVAKFKIHSSKLNQSKDTEAPSTNPHFCKAHDLTNKFLRKNGLEIFAPDQKPISAFNDTLFQEQYQNYLKHLNEKLLKESSDKLNK